MLPAPDRPSFTDDILPLFQRLAGLQWVNAAYAAGYGWQGAFDLTSEETLRQLSSAGPALSRAASHHRQQFPEFLA